MKARSFISFAESDEDDNDDIELTELESDLSLEKGASFLLGPLISGTF